MLRVGYLFERFPSFGQTFCYREVSELLRQGADVTVFSIRRPKDEPPQDWNAKVLERVTYLPEEAELVQEMERARARGELPESATRALKDWGRQTDFLRLYQAAWIGARLRDAGIERVHAHFAGMAARTAYWLKEFFGIDYSLTAHANDIFVPRDFVVNLHKLFARAAALVTVSDFAVGQLRKRFPESAGKIHRVYNGIEIERFPPAAIGGGSPVVLSIGRLIEKKGFDDLIAACSILQAKGENFRCEIIGEGPLEANLRAQIAGARLENFVHLLGPKTQSEIAERLGAAALFVLPCRVSPEGDMDNLPTVIMEAMAVGLPVVSTSLAGIPEMVHSGESGLLVSPNDSPALAQAMSALLSDRELARRYGARGRELARTKFSVLTNVAALAAILRAA